MSKDLKSLEEIEVRLAKLDGQCVHEWEAKFAPMNMAGGKKVYWYCYKCETPDNNPNREPPAVDNLVCQSLAKLTDYAVEKFPNTVIHIRHDDIQEGNDPATVEAGIEFAFTDGRPNCSVKVLLKDYPSPSAAELHVMANAVLQARESK